MGRAADGQLHMGWRRRRGGEAGAERMPCVWALGLERMLIPSVLQLAQPTERGEDGEPERVAARKAHRARR